MFINPYLDGFIALPYRKHLYMFGLVPIDPNAITLIHVAAANFHLAQQDTMTPILSHFWFKHTGGNAGGRKKCEKVHNKPRIGALNSYWCAGQKQGQ